MREFDSGATRNEDADKYDYEGFLSPLVLKRYAEYMHSHRKQADGKMRDSDNWQNLFGPCAESHTKVCMKSLMRHTMTLWLTHRGSPQDESFDDTLCASMFNIMAILHSRLRERETLREEQT